MRRLLATALPWATVLVLATVLLLATNASAYTVIRDNQGGLFQWPSSPVGWWLASSSSDLPQAEVEAALKSSFDAWQTVGCSSISFTYGGVKTNPTTGVVIKWKESTWDLASGDALAVTTNWSFGFSGPTRVEILFNGVDYSWSTAGEDDSFSNVMDVGETAVHEIGHTLGLDHSREPEASMWFTSRAGADASTLAADDERGACFLYPQGSFTAGQVCDACESSDNCGNGLCINYGGSEGPYCGQDCQSSSDCADGYACYSLNGAPTPQCLPNNDHCGPVGNAIPLGAFCYDHATCASGTCLTTQDAAVCTQDCTPGGGGNGGCPNDMTCLATQGGGGICYPKGNAALGESCVSSTDCVTFQCVGVGLGVGVCTQECSTSKPCPGAAQCLSGSCFKPGAATFGGACGLFTDCASLVCFKGKCSEDCKSDADCDGESKCGTTGLCEPGPTGKLHDVCGSNGVVCTSAYFCFQEDQTKTVGTCEVRCDTRADDCPVGNLCRWVYQAASDKVVGVCTDAIGGISVGGACGGAGSCQYGLVCADLGEGPHCYRDCNAKNLLGCGSGETCEPLGIASDPKLGACKQYTAVDGTDAADGTSGADTTDGADAVDGATDGVAAGDGSDATDASVGADATDAVDGADATDGAAGSDTSDAGTTKRSSGGRSSCTAGVGLGGSRSAVWVGVFALLLCTLRRRR